ncbi:unnamed protein product [Calypogeia fissa]
MDVVEFGLLVDLVCEPADSEVLKIGGGRVIDLGVVLLAPGFGHQFGREREVAAPNSALRKPVFIKVDQLRPGTAGHTLLVKVVSSKLVLQKARPECRYGSRAIALEMI